MNILATYNPGKVSEAEFSLYKKREAVRGIVRDEDNLIATLYKNDRYYALPGGGVDAGEAFTDAFIRECKEEIGGEIDTPIEVGITIEYLPERQVENITHVFITTALSKGEPMIVGDEDESEKACVVKWVDRDEVINIIEEMLKPTLEEKRFRLERDLVILKQK